MDPNSEKQAAAEAAAEEVRSGMIVGLGSGSTAALAVRAIGRRVAQGLEIIGVPTSDKTAELARSLGIRLSTLDEHHRIDLTIDGADEVEQGTLNLVKGLGGALLREKLVASATTRLVIIVDESKIVERLRLHQGPIPVEVVPFGFETTADRLRAMGAVMARRNLADGQPFITDGGNCILDCGFPSAETATALQQQLDGTVGVVEHGLFLGMTAKVIIGLAGRVESMERRV
jgi:ribose 5-phosphate isomerase A